MQPPPTATDPRTAPGWFHRAILGGALLLALGLYAQTLGFGFVWDDVAEIRDNPLLHGALGPGLLATNHEHMGVRRADWLAPSHESLRPLRYLSYRLDAAIHGLKPGAMHAHNVLLACGGLFIAYLLGRLWGLGRVPASLAAAVFLLHPLQVEPTAYISLRSDLLGGILALAALALAARALHDGQLSWRLLGASVGCFLAALGAKEAAILVVFAAVIHGFARMGSRGAVRWAPLRWMTFTYAVAAAAWLLLRSSVVRGATTASPTDMVVALGGLPQYLRMFVAPLDSSIVRPVDSGGLAVGVAMLAVLLGSCAWLLARPASPAAGRYVPLLALLYFATIPSLFASGITGIASDRYAYIAVWPLAALALQAAGDLIELRPALRHALWGLGSAWALAMVVLATTLVPAWRNPITLYAHALRVEPTSAAAHFGLGSAVIDGRGCDLAEPLFRRATELDPNHRRAWNNLAVCQMRRGALDEAATTLQHTLDLTDGLHAKSWANLGQVRLAQGRIDQACAHFDHAIEIAPGHAFATALRARHCADGSRRPAVAPAVTPPQEQTR